MRYGVPYKGSKSAIAPWVVSNLPSAGVLYDLFAGGCAVTHCAMLSGRYKKIVCNDITDAPKLFFDAINGKYSNERRWISREEFYRLKDSDPYIRLCWSFGNNGKDYLYSREIEPYKRACHMAIVEDDWDQLHNLCPEITAPCRAALAGVTDMRQRRLRFGGAVVTTVRRIGEQGNPLYGSIIVHSDNNTRRVGTVRDLRNQTLNITERLQNIERLERLQENETITRTERLQNIERLEMDYQDVKIAPGSVVYCDPPYNNTDCGSYKGFDHDRFYQWAKSQENLIVISEYDMPDGFTTVASVKKTVNSAANMTIGGHLEKLFVPTHQLERYKQAMGMIF